MLIFWFGLLIMAGGLGAVGYLLLNEKKQEQQEEQPAEAIPAKPEISIQSFLQRLNLGGKEKNAFAEPPVKPSRFDFLKTLSSLTKKNSPSIEKISFPDSSQKQLPEGTASLRLDPEQISAVQSQSNSSKSQPQAPSDEVDIIIRAEESEKELKQAQERYERLDKMFQEKSIALEKSEKNLAVELKSHKEFNKIKDVLEKEIKELRDKSRNLEIAVASAQTEGQSFLKRVNQLEEKIKILEKEAREKEEEIRQAQQTAELQKTKAADLEAKLKKSDELIQEKMKKINDLVGHLQDNKPKAIVAAAPITVTPEEPSSSPATVVEEPVPPEPTMTPQEAIPMPTAAPTSETEKPSESPSSEENQQEGRPMEAVSPLKPTPLPEISSSEPDKKQKTIDALKDTFKEAFTLSSENPSETVSAVPENQPSEPSIVEDNTVVVLEEEIPPPPKGVPVADLLNLIKSSEPEKENKEVHLMPDILAQQNEKTDGVEPTEDESPPNPNNSDNNPPQNK